MDNYNIKRIAVCLICLIVMASCICISVRARATAANGYTADCEMCSASVSEPQIAARAAVVMEYESGRVLFEKNADTKLPMASTTKIMTTLLTLESGDLDEWFTVDSQAIKVEGSSMGLTEGRIVSKRILCYGMMLPSGNDAANASAVAVAGSIDGFAELMNRKAEELGLDNTHFVTPSGLDDYTDEHYSTAYDMALLTRAALNNDDFRDICSTRSISLNFGNGDEFWLSNSNRLLSSCDGVIGVKTGFTDKAGRCLVSACERDGVTLICVTLSDPNDWYDHSNLYDYCFTLVTSVELAGEDFFVPCAGDCFGDEFVFAASDSTSVVLPSGVDYANRIEKTVYLPRFIYLPVKCGETIGRVLYTLDGETVAMSDIKITAINGE